MKPTTRSNIALPREDLALLEGLRKRLRAKSKIDVVRRGLRLLRDTTGRDALRAQYAEASRKVRASTLEELSELDGPRFSFGGRRTSGPVAG